MPFLAQDTGQPNREALEKVVPKQGYSLYAARNFAIRTFWGDTHLHTSYSMDAGAFGARLSPRDAYVFAKGNEVTSSSGQPVRLARRLDFLVVAGGKTSRGTVDLKSEFRKVSYDRENHFMLIEIDDDELSFKAISETGELVDEGFIKQA